MAGKLVIFKSDLWIKRSVVLAVWVLSFLSFIIVTGNNGLSTLSNEAGGYDVELIPAKNQTGALSYWCCDPEANGRLVHSVDLKNLRAENSHLGILKTSLHKIVSIDGLELELHQYTSSAATGNSSSDIYAVPENVMADVHSLVEQISHHLTNPIHGWRVKNIDLGNVSEVLVDNFDYRVFRDGGLLFMIQSSKAMLSYRRSGIVLRGRVTLATADGSTLKSGHVEWEVEEQRFTAKGVYVLDRSGVRTTGKDICVDARLNRIGTMHTKVQYKEEHKCHAKL